MTVLVRMMTTMMSKTSVRRALARIYATLSKGWCRYYSAVYKRGKPIAVHSKKACRFCLSGAMSKRIKSPQLFNAVRNVLVAKLPVGYFDVVDYNDSSYRKKSEILGLVRSADEEVALSKDFEHLSGQA
jgi:hypothetical protein